MRDPSAVNYHKMTRIAGNVRVISIRGFDILRRLVSEIRQQIDIRAFSD